jgi:Flp pilus assembly pilin Flp
MKIEKKLPHPLRKRRTLGATTVEWVVLAMIIGVAMIAVWNTFMGKVEETLTNGGDQVKQL